MDKTRVAMEPRPVALTPGAEVVEAMIKEAEEVVTVEVVGVDVVPWGKMTASF